MRRLASVLFWSVIAAAFIGPGTVTTAAAAGAGYGLALVWALVFSTAACLVLQEASARLTIVSGRTLGEALRRQYHGGPAGLAVLLLVLGAIVLGCAAYEAGNILGGVAGLALGVPVSPRLATLGVGAAAALLLWVGRSRDVARLLGLFVAVMGIAFLVTASRLAPHPVALLRGSVVPSLPTGSDLLVLGLVGTTVVPYNLFLGSGLARGQRLGEMRSGLAVAIVLGGVISIGIVVVGTAVEGPFAFESLSQVLGNRLGRPASLLFAVGLFAAGFSSAVTAPLAAAVTAGNLFEARGPATAERWGERSWRFRAVWGGVLLVGVGFGLADVRPVPAIVLAQALNGLLLPLVTVFLLLGVNDRRLMGREINRPLANGALTVVAAVALLLGISNLGRALATGLGLAPPSGARILLWSLGLAVAGAIPLWRRVRRLRGPE